MQLSRNRKVIVLLALAGLVFVGLRLISHHYYQLTWAACAPEAWDRIRAVAGMPAPETSTPTSAPAAGGGDVWDRIRAAAGTSEAASASASPLCATWALQAALEAVLVVLLAAAAWVWWRPPTSP